MAWAAADHAFKTLTNEDVERLKRAAAQQQKPDTGEASTDRIDGADRGVSGRAGGIRQVGRMGVGRMGGR